MGLRNNAGTAVCHGCYRRCTRDFIIIKLPRREVRCSCRRASTHASFYLLAYIFYRIFARYIFPRNVYAASNTKTSNHRVTQCCSKNCRRRGLRIKKLEMSSLRSRILGQIKSIFSLYILLLNHLCLVIFFSIFFDKRYLLKLMLLL